MYPRDSGNDRVWTTSLQSVGPEVLCWEAEALGAGDVTSAMMIMCN